ncbi:MAG: hypothetical protein PHW34_16385 [Hespellia sp.]|nr:hypothetical protein [Hespellia sp.]
MGNLDLYEKVKSVPETAKKRIEAGRTKGFTDINPMWRIKTLTEQFGPCGIGWYYKTTNKWIEDGGEVKSAFVDIELFICLDGIWSKPIAGTGGSAFVSKEKSGLYVSDECYKMATTDALSVACKQLGIGADVYFSKDVSKYDNKNIEQVQQEGNEQWLCDNCGKPFEPMDFKGKHYTSKMVYENAAQHNNGVALCRKCKEQEKQGAS